MILMMHHQVLVCACDVSVQLTMCSLVAAFRSVSNCDEESQRVKLVRECRQMCWTSQ